MFMWFRSVDHPAYKAFCGLCPGGIGGSSLGLEAFRGRWSGRQGRALVVSKVEVSCLTKALGAAA
jgi:hypothetical protein